MGVYRAEYIWIDGTQPTQKLRSKTKLVPTGEKAPIWAFDGSSTQQATGDRSDCVLQPVFTCPDPIRGGDNKLVLCEVMLVSGAPHPTNMRRANLDMARRYSSYDTWFGIEQEYTFFEGSRPLGFPDVGFPAPQGGYYCGVGADEVFGREVVEAHLSACLTAGLKISGINAEVMPGQWEFQVGPLNAPDIGDQLWVARWLLYRVGEDFGVSATLYPKPVRGDWNGAGAHTNFSTKQMRSDYDACVRVGAHPLAGREGSQGLHRGPPSERERRPVRHDASDHRDRVWRGGGQGQREAGEGRGEEDGEGTPRRLTSPRGSAGCGHRAWSPS